MCNSNIDLTTLRPLIGDIFSFVGEIGKGSFGKVYKLRDKNTNKEYACKIEKKGAKNRLRNEWNIYKIFKARNVKCVPYMYQYMGEPKNNLLIIELLGKSLECIFEECNKHIDIGTVMKIGITLINHMEKIHRSGVIHRDIKPNNFMFGLGKNESQLYVMDFGLSKRWYDNETHDHIQCKTDRSMIGTARYASLNIHMGLEPSRRDDMESIGYMLIYLVSGSLPWQGLKKKTKENPIDKIGEKKLMVDIKELCKDLPSCFYDYINYTRNLQFTEKPDYNYLTNLFKKSAEDMGINLKYYWEQRTKSDKNKI